MKPVSIPTPNTQDTVKNNSQTFLRFSFRNMMQYIKGSEMKEYEKKLILTQVIVHEYRPWICPTLQDSEGTTPCALLENKYSHQRESSIQMKKLGKLQKDVQ